MIKLVTDIYTVDWMTEVQFLVGAMMGFFFLHHHICTSSWAHLTSYPLGPGGLFLLA